MDARPCREKYRFLVPSNPEAADDVYIYAALLTPHAIILADFVREFGMARVRSAWEKISRTTEGRAVAQTVERILGNFEIGLALREAHAQRATQ